VVLACSDSRVPPEMVFDQGLGDIYVVRRARLLQTYPTLAPQRCSCVRSRGRQRSAHGRCPCVSPGGVSAAAPVSLDSCLA